MGGLRIVDCLSIEKIRNYPLNLLNQRSKKTILNSTF